MDPTPLDRLMGVEHEYAVVHRPAPSVEHPGNRAIFGAIVASLSRRIKTHAAGGPWGASRGRVFTQSGGSLYYESLPQADDGGLVEASTPECRGPTETLRYARAWDQLLLDAARDAGRQLGGPVVLRKNGCDAQGHVYGPQESYEVDQATGWRLVALQATVVLLAPCAFAAAILHLSTVMVLCVAGIGVLLVAMLLASAQELVQHAAGLDGGSVRERWFHAMLRLLAFGERMSLSAWFGPVVAAYSAAIHLFAWRDHRRGALAFLSTRMVVTGAGRLADDGTLHLSEKAHAIRRVMRWNFGAHDRGMIETGHLLKGLIGPMLLRPAHLWALLARRQRLQIGIGDANLCEVAELLKLGTTSLVLDLVEAGRLDDAPQLADPVGALHAVSERGLRAVLRLVDGSTTTPLAVQRYYLDRAVQWLASLETPSLEAHALVVRWMEVLDALEHDPRLLVGQLDWVTKGALLDDAGDDLPYEARKKIDLGYHDLGEGYFAWLAGAGVAVPVVAQDTVDRATREPPFDSPAQLRGEIVSRAGAHRRVLLDWRTAKVDGRVIDFAEELRRRGGR